MFGSRSTFALRMFSGEDVCTKRDLRLITYSAASGGPERTVLASPLQFTN